MKTPIQSLTRIILDACERMESQAGYTTDLEARDSLRAFANQTRKEVADVLIALPENQPLRVHVTIGGMDEWSGEWQHFCQINAALGEVELGEILKALRSGLRYLGGGGAAGEFSVEVAK